jgi:hypothetical protein
MRSGSQTFSRNQYAPIFGEQERTSLNPGTQPAVERSKSNHEWTRLLPQPRDFRLLPSLPGLWRTRRRGRLRHEEDSLPPFILVFGADRPADLTRTAIAKQKKPAILESKLPVLY